MKGKHSIIPALFVCSTTASNLSLGLDLDQARLAVGDEPLPKGVIVMWSGALAEIPNGWILCDGNNGTPDLRDRFVMGAGTSQYQGTFGGSFTHSHTGANHSHRITPPNAHLKIISLPDSRRKHPHFIFRSHRYYSGGRPYNSGSASTRTENARLLPPYFKLAFIMKTR